MKVNLEELGDRYWGTQYFWPDLVRGSDEELAVITEWASQFEDGLEELEKMILLPLQAGDNSAAKRKAAKQKNEPEL